VKVDIYDYTKEQLLSSCCHHILLLYRNAVEASVKFFFSETEQQIKLQEYHTYTAQHRHNYKTKGTFPNQYVGIG